LKNKKNKKAGEEQKNKIGSLFCLFFSRSPFGGPTAFSTAFYYFIVITLRPILFTNGERK